LDPNNGNGVEWRVRIWLRKDENLVRELKVCKWQEGKDADFILANIVIVKKLECPSPRP
jgi:hypothetical protein